MKRKRRSSTSSAAGDVLLKLVDFGLAGVIFLAPLWMGGRQPLGQLVYIAFVSLTATVWLLRQCTLDNGSWRRSLADPLLAGGLVLLVLQLVPLPESVLGWLSPAAAQRLALWSADAPLQLGAWHQVSLYPNATRASLLLYLAHGMLMLVVIQRVGKVSDVERLLRWTAAAGAMMAAIGLLQLLSGSEKFLTFYQHPFRPADDAAKGTFANQNHFAHFLMLSVLALIWMLYDTAGAAGRSRSSRGRRRSGAANPAASFNLAALGERPQLLLAATLLAVTLFGCLLSFSRGGVAVLMLAVSTTAVLMACRGLVGAKTLVGVGVLGALVAAALWMHGMTRLTRELESLDTAVLGADQLRQRLWTADIEGFLDHPILGVGAGTHAEAYPTYLADFASVEYTHAESGYIQLLLETGTVGVLLMLAAAAVCGWWCLGAWRKAESTRESVLAAVLISALVASAVHSIWDFVWYIPACFSITVIYAACLCRLYQMQSPCRDAARNRRSSPAAPYYLGRCDSGRRVPGGNDDSRRPAPRAGPNLLGAIPDRRPGRAAAAQRG